MSTVMDRLLKYGLAFVAKPGKVAHTSLVYTRHNIDNDSNISTHTHAHTLYLHTTNTLVYFVVFFLMNDKLFLN